MPQTERIRGAWPTRQSGREEKNVRMREISRASHSACGWFLPTQLAFEPLAAQQPRLKRAYRRLSVSAKKLSRRVSFISDSPFSLSSYYSADPSQPPSPLLPSIFDLLYILSHSSPCWPSALSPALPGTACEQLPALPPPGRFRYEAQTWA